jgi:RNA polymerase sigma-70 factor, ECF subfamily
LLFKVSKRKSPQRSEEELIAEFCSTGDLGLLGELYSGYMHLVYGVCLKYLKDTNESKDAVMQIFEKLIIEIPRHKIENFRSWLHVVTKNYCLMQLRSGKTKDERLREIQGDPLFFMESVSFVHPIDDEVPELEQDLSDCIKQLGAEQKECINKFYYENRCYREIAQDMGLDEKKVKSYLQNAKRNLKLCLEKKHVGQE